VSHVAIILNLLNKRAALMLENIFIATELSTRGTVYPMLYFLHHRPKTLKWTFVKSTLTDF